MLSDFPNRPSSPPPASETSFAVDGVLGGRVKSAKKSAPLSKQPSSISSRRTAAARACALGRIAESPEFCHFGRNDTECAMSDQPDQPSPIPEPDLKAEVASAVSSGSRAYQLTIVVLLFVIAGVLIGIAALLVSAGLTSHG